MLPGDIERARPNPINGFPRLASKIASDPDKTTTIYRRFDKLSARNLLYLEAEIAELETLQNQHDEADLKSADSTTISCHSDWRKFQRCAGEQDAHGEFVHLRQKEKMELALRIKHKLKEYHEALAVHKTLLNSKPPASTTVRAMRNWFLDTTSDKVESRPQLWGSSAKKYDDVHDLVALRVPADQDRLSEFILNYFSYFFKATRQDGQSAYISERSVAKFVAILSSILSAILLFGSITSLYFVHNPYALLGMLGGWTVLFATCVGWLTNAKRGPDFRSNGGICSGLGCVHQWDFGWCLSCSYGHGNL
ncbi:uncharacterized protein LY89DRAFT_651306 [Mollisia scopiformis]|uniref:DUF6594 domain-containing protein n=1 Tax=Mollisia scopiformis TaxID=149040 RepID=A0A194X005_MOLSC|nr:uncharacterized protein LY89DRAFT_651306 [Mollisia scopiformis]KUJ13202.1 hypothetical protein LY89DRAFT_651306 [Mollisia scopiformis]